MQRPDPHPETPSRRLLLLLLPLVALLLLAIPSGIALSASPDVALDVIPSSVDLPSTGQVEVQVELSNLSTDTLQHIRLSWFTNVGIKVVPASLPTVAGLAPGAQYVWTVPLARDVSAMLPGTLQFRVDYTRPAQGQPGCVSRAAFATLTVQDLKPQPVEQVADIQVVSSFTSLNEQQPGQVYLLITNKSDYPIEIKRILPSVPDFIKVELDPNKFKDGAPLSALTIAPRQTRPIPVSVAISGPLQPGKQLLVFQVAFQWLAAGQTQTGNLVASQQVDVGVLGESQILTLLGIPSFLLLPGFLALVSFRLLFLFFKWPSGGKSAESRSTEATPQDDSKLPLAALGLRGSFNQVLQVTRPEFWMGAITLSGIFAVIYPIATQRFTGIRRDYLVGYELTDMVSIWLVSVLFGLVFCFFLWLLLWVYARLKDYWSTPSRNDKPVALLLKLKRQGLSAKLPYVTLKIAGQENMQVYLLQPFKKGQNQYWVGPAINVTPVSGGETEKLKLQGNLVNHLKQASALENDNPEAVRLVKQLADLLQQGDRIAWNVGWDKESLKQHDRPFPVKEGQIPEPSASPVLIVKYIP